MSKDKTAAMKILVTGAYGQLGSEIRDQHQAYKDDTFVFVDIKEMPLDDTEKVTAVLEEVQPDVIISAGAHTAVDKAERSEERRVGKECRSSRWWCKLRKKMKE